MGIHLTETAANEVKSIIEEHQLNEQATYLRVGVRGGGCSGYQFILDLTENFNENDLFFESNNIKVVCDERSHMYLQNCTIDFKDEIMGRGFVFDVPNATSKCGCGKSASF